MKIVFINLRDRSAIKGEQKYINHIILRDVLSGYLAIIVIDLAIPIIDFPA